jgi:GNAT superfamily N-acetyltransferase
MEQNASGSSGQVRAQVIRAGDLRSSRLSSEFKGGHDYLLSGLAKDLFLDNPCGISDEDPIQVIAVLDDVIVGRINMLKGQMLYRGQNINMQWASGYKVDADRRGKGIGKALLTRMEECGDVFGAIGASRYSFPIFEKFGWHCRSARRLLIVKRSLSIVQRNVKARVLAVPISKVLDACMGIHRGLLSAFHPRPHQCQVREVDVVPDHAFPCDAAKSGGNILTFPRNPDWLRWLISHTHCRDGDWRRQYVVADASGACLGYFLVSTTFHEVASRHGYKNLRLCTVKDWQAIDGRPESNRLIAILAVQEAMKADVDVVELCTADDRLATELKRCGAVTKGAMPLHIKQRGGGTLPLAATGIESTWDFRAADGDYWFF